MLQNTIDQQNRENYVASTKGDKSYFHGKSESVGVLLVNLGTPDEPTTSAVRKYLSQFLSDSRVVEIPRLIWLPILHGIVLRKRPAASAENYKKVWTDKGSPLLYIGLKQAKRLQQEMESRFKGPVHIELAMRYGKPSINNGLEALQKKGAHRILVLPLYPQYSATTTATTFDAIAKIMAGWRWIPEFRFVNQYHDFAPYIEALAKSVKEHWRNNQQGEVLLMSFHGLPKRNLDLGDPYFCQCHKTARLLAKKLELKDSQWKITFQSRFGKAEWLKPYTDKMLMKLPSEGIKSVDIICPGFPADCLETLEEINGENREYFEEAGGENYHYIPALNNTPSHIHALSDLIQLHTQGWHETSDDWSAPQIEKNNELSKQYATARGAKI